ncbi:MAG: pirin family protein [Thermoleophilia bacterium]
MKGTERKAAVFVRPPDTIYHTHGKVENGSFSGCWHFSFDEYHEREYSFFGTLRALNDDTLTPGATWPLHPHRNIEVVTYCVEGEFRHADENGVGHILHAGWVQHISIGRGMWHSEINNRRDAPMRFIQMWFLPREPDLEPSLQVKKVERAERTNRLLPLVSNEHVEALPIASDALVYASYLEAGERIKCELGVGRGAYIYVLKGGPVWLHGHEIPELGAAKVIGGMDVELEAGNDAELLAIGVPLAVGNHYGI